MREPLNPDHLADMSSPDALRTIGEIHFTTGKTEDAIACYAQALDLEQQRGNWRGEAVTWMALGKISRAERDLDATIACFTKALACYHAGGARPEQATTLLAIGDAHCSKYELDPAMDTYSRALELYHALGDAPGEINVQVMIGEIQGMRGQVDDALATCTQAAALAETIGDQLGQANAHKALGALQALRGERELALTHCTQALELYQTVGSQHGEANVLARQSLLWLEDDPARSRATLEAALKLRQELGATANAGIDLGNYGQALLLRGRAEDAFPYLQEALAILMKHRMQAEVQWVVGLLSEAAEQLPARSRHLPAVPRGKPRPAKNRPA
jgi:tetratricopeptide (TPR) repeat protein